MEKLKDLKLGDYWHCMECGTPTIKGKPLCDKCIIAGNNKEIKRLKEERKHEDKLKRKYLDQLADQHDEVKQLKKALDEIDGEADNTYENSEVPELNDCIDRMQQIAKQVR